MAQGSFASRKKKRKKRRLGTWNKKWQNLKEQIEKRQKQKQETCKDTKQKWGEVEAEGVDFCKEAEQMQGEKGKKKNKNLGNQSNHSVHKKKYLNKRANQTSLLAVTQQSPLWLFEKLLFKGPQLPCHTYNYCQSQGLSHGITASHLIYDL